jgi:hypothetical protein
MSTLTRFVSRLLRSYTKTSEAPFPSPGTRSLALDVNATSWPFVVTDGWLLESFPGSPSVARLIKRVESGGCGSAGLPAEAAGAVTPTSNNEVRTQIGRRIDMTWCLSQSSPTR